MRVVYLHQHFATRAGHGGTRSYEFARHMIASGDHVDMICGRNSKSNFGATSAKGTEIRDIDGITAHIIDVPYGNHLSFARRLWAFFAYAISGTIEGLRCKDPDLIFATSTPITVAVPGMITAFVKRRPLVFEVRDIWPESAIATGALKSRPLIMIAEWLERLVYRRSKRIIALSDRMKSALCKATGTPPEKVDVVHIGADLELFGQARDDSFRKKHGLEDLFLAAFTGAHGTANGLEVLVEAGKFLPDDMRIVLIGEGGQKKRLMEKARRLQVDGRILFFDPIPKSELAGALTAMDCGLQILDPLPIFETVAPNKFFDYAASGLPIVVNFPGEVADQVTANEAGIFVAESTPENIAAALVALRDDPEARKRYGANARAMAAAFDRHVLAARFRAILAEVAGGR